MRRELLRTLLAGTAALGSLSASASFAGEKSWAFEPVKQVEPPPGDSTNPIDRFIRQKLSENSLRPAGPAEPRTLIRRVTFDLTGLPPTPEEVDAFVADKSPDAFAKVIDRLLASPRYGERWGRHWLDVVRYADTGGFEADHLYPNAWKYRDYVIRSFNADKPFDRFVQEQIAGDELWPDNPDAVVATGLYCVGPTLPESAMVSNQLEYEWLTDAADTTGAAFLGLTFGCARCHDHKYDPLTQKDYFGLQAVFAASDRPYPDKVRLLQIKGLNGLLSDAPVPKELLDDPRCKIRLDNEVGLKLFHRDEPMPVHRLRRGELSKPAEAVAAGLPAKLSRGDQQAFGERRRATFAKWLTSPENPLTARVFVNRIWAWHFGRGIVGTPSDFGAQGEPPTHPELLDWLARDFIEHGWQIKRLHRLIVQSDTYRLVSVGDGRGTKVDPESRLLRHFPRQRLEGEAIRDAMLACAGTLNQAEFGPPVVPPLGTEELTGLFDAKAKWVMTEDRSQHTRRSVYLLVRRTFAYPLLAAFDPPGTMASCPQRPRTIVPTQALTLLNSPAAREQSAAFARRLLKECGGRPEEIVPRAWRLAFGRNPTAAETERSLAFVAKRSLAAKQESAVTELCLALFNANEFVFVD
ncbi:MAG TPA: DUF1549 and DUF1553 domain-containing protein [Gemmataceae bacterium]|nr:DUF1549 and DUF1553 domain-containing protein [Gemmataceae bacterium]